MLFSGQDNPQKLPLPMGDLDLHPIHSSFGPHESALKLHLDLCSHFCMAKERDQQTDYTLLYSPTMLHSWTMLLRV